MSKPKHGYTTREGRRKGYYEGENGRKHTYTPGDEAERKKAKKMANQSQNYDRTRISRKSNRSQR